jgi:hypothetical protein
MPRKKIPEGYSKRPCSTKPTLEQERQIEQLEKEEKLTRSDIMRDALCDYLTQKRLLRMGKEVRKDPVSSLHEKILREQIDPLRQQVEVIAEILKGVTRTVTNLDERARSTPSLLLPKEERNQVDNSLSIKFENAYKLLEQVYICALLNQSLLSNFLAEPSLQTITGDDSEAFESVIKRIQMKEQGWSKVTFQAVELIREQAGNMASLVINDIEEETKALHRGQSFKTHAAAIPAGEIIGVT